MGVGGGVGVEQQLLRLCGCGAWHVTAAHVQTEGMREDERVAAGQGRADRSLGRLRGLRRGWPCTRGDARLAQVHPGLMPG